MDKETVFRAEHVNTKYLPSRSVVQIVLETPIENADQIHKILGAPMPGATKHVAVALLTGG